MNNIRYIKKKEEKKLNTYLNEGNKGHCVLEILEKKKFFIPLKNTELTGTIKLPFADLHLKQKFSFSREEFDQTIQALYRFPLPGNAAVKEVVVNFGDTQIKTILKERSKAEKNFKQAVVDGKQAALVSRESPNVFTLRISGIHPDEIVKIDTHYVQILRPINGGYEFRLPLTTFPRYVRDDEFQSRHARGQPLALLRDPQHRFSMDIEVYGADKIDSKSFEINRNEENITISDVIPNRDLILNLTVSKKEHPTIQLITHDDEDYIYFGVLATPPETTDKVKMLSFVEAIDHSGSMGSPDVEGSKWNISDFVAKMTYLEIKDNAKQIYIGAFDTQTWWIEVKNQDYLEEFLSRRFGGGGTHLGAAIEEGIHKHKNIGDATKYNIIITDAQVSDYGRLFRLADKIRDMNQHLVIICIDTAPNAYIPIEMARRAGGLSFFLDSSAGSDMINAVEHISRYWRDPLGNLQIKVDTNLDDIELEHSQGLHKGNMLELGDLTKNMARWAVGRVSKRKNQSLQFTLLVDGKEYDKIKIGSGEEKNPFIKDVFGVNRINYLESLINARYNSDDLTQLLIKIGYNLKLKDNQEMIYSDNKLKLTRQSLDELLVDISLKFGLVSKETSFIAVTEREGKVTDTYIVPNAIPKNAPPLGPPVSFKSYAMSAPAPPGAPQRTAQMSSPRRQNAFMSINSGIKNLLGGSSRSSRGSRSHPSREKEYARKKEIFKGKTKKGEFYISKEKIKLSSIEVSGEVPNDAELFIYLKGESTPSVIIDLARVKLLGKRPLNIYGYIRLESNVDGVKIKLR
ncbi:MAG: VWA domain-containing protein [Candidatus Lokiarchaeota archaeon]|nr:VWA domain-containing protein [Candidatus Lokiarchaeota archaeon]